MLSTLPLTDLADHAVRLCRELLRLDTTNPPGREKPAAELLADELSASGLSPSVLEAAPGRASVVARVAGTGAEPPLLLTGHLDVVAADPAEWEVPPFAGEVIDGCLWGRGAIDAKNLVAMAAAIVCGLSRHGVRLRRDVIFAAVADEETGGALGSHWLCEHHPELVRASHAIGEGGGASVHLGDHVVYPVEVAEKGYCWVRARARGPSGHGSVPRPDAAVARLAEAVERLSRSPLPFHLVPEARDYIRELGRLLPGGMGFALRGLVHGRLSDRALGTLHRLGWSGDLLPLLSNTANVTSLSAGSGQPNVIPRFAEAIIDGRTLPGQTAEDFLRELGEVLGDDIELEVLRVGDPVTSRSSSPLLEVIEAVLRARDPRARLLPSFIPGFTDAKAFARLGTSWVGFAPVALPPTMDFGAMFHGPNERIPVDGLRWGTEVLAEVVLRFAGADPAA